MSHFTTKPLQIRFASLRVQEMYYDRLCSLLSKNNLPYYSSLQFCQSLLVKVPSGVSTALMWKFIASVETDDTYARVLTHYRNTHPMYYFYQITDVLVK